MNHGPQQGIPEHDPRREEAGGDAGQEEVGQEEVALTKKVTEGAMTVRIRGDPTIATPTTMAVECVTPTLMADHVRFADRGTCSNGVRGGCCSSEQVC